MRLSLRKPNRLLQFVANAVINRRLSHSRLSGRTDPYFSPVRFFPSIMTLLKIRFIRVW